MEKEQILAEIRRTADANGGTPLGRKRFETETGIRERDWYGRFWARWSDALVEAGYAPNELQGRTPEGVLFTKLAEEVRRLGRLPTRAELDLRRRGDDTFPSAEVFTRRLGPKATWPAQLVQHFEGDAEMADVVAILEPLVIEAEPEDEPLAEPGERGFVYLLKSGRFYKIGYTLDVGASQVRHRAPASRARDGGARDSHRRPCRDRALQAPALRRQTQERRVVRVEPRRREGVQAPQVHVGLRPGERTLAQASDLLRAWFAGEPVRCAP